MDENHTYPESSYALSKVVSEEIARQFSRWRDIPIVGLRLSNIITPDEYVLFREFQDDPAMRKWNLWGYVDVRDVAQGCRRALEAKVVGARNYIIAAADTVMNRPSARLMEEVFPQVRITRQLDTHETLLSIDRARTELGYHPEYSWRDSLT